MLWVGGNSHKTARTRSHPCFPVPVELQSVGRGPVPHILLCSPKRLPTDTYHVFLSTFIPPFAFPVQFDPGSLSSSRPDVTHAAEAAKRKLMHSLLAAEAMAVVYKMDELEPLIATLSACATLDFGWGSLGADGGSRGHDEGRGAGKARKGTGVGAEAAAEAARGAGAEAGAVTGRVAGLAAAVAEVPLAQTVIQRMCALAGTKRRMFRATQAPGDCVYADKHIRLWEVVAACPPSAQLLCKPLLNASAKVLPSYILDQVHPMWPYRMLLAMPRLQHLPNISWPLHSLLARRALYAGAGENWELCQNVGALGKLLLAGQATRLCSAQAPVPARLKTRAALSLVARSVLEIVQHVQWRLGPHQEDMTDEEQQLADVAVHGLTLRVVAAMAATIRA